MSKSEKRRRKPAKNRGHQQASSRNQTEPRTQSSVPSVQTVWRTMYLDWRIYDKLVEAAIKLQPPLWKRDADKIQEIEQAADIEAVLDLAADATGLASYAWPKRIREFGPNAANHIVARLDSDWMRRHARDRTAIQEHYIGALRWCEDGAADALAHCWDSLDDYGRSLGCIVLGLVGARQSADRLWAFYRHARSVPQTLLVGPLWGLIDLGDERAADALIDAMLDQRAFYEKYGFLSRAGDARAVLPLISDAACGSEETRADALWALTGVAHRVGREGVYQMLRMDTDTSDADNSRLDAFIDQIFRYSQKEVEEHFELFYDMDARSIVLAAEPQGYTH
jgi:hypothetical protein